MKTRNLVIAVVATILVSISPFIMYMSWLLQPKKELKIAVIDKTVLSSEGNEHKSLNWILTYNKFCKPNRDLYSITEDYYGFFPNHDSKYSIKDFENFDSEGLKKFADKTDMIYLTDTYGLYRNDLFGRNLRGEYSPLIYGGTTEKEFSLLKIMKAQHKLVMAEFNTIASPTSKVVKTQFEELYGLKWTGWTGRFFDKLDTTVNKEFPVWVIRDYKTQHQNQWPFKKSGIVLVNENGRLEILEYKRDLKEEVPYIISSERNQKRFGIPQKIKYSYWFDVMKTKRSNNVVSVYQIFSNSRGDSLLNALEIPNPFPAVIEHYDNDYKFYYFCGDFCDNPVEMILSRFYGVTKFRWIFFSQSDLAERESFFWLYYQPIVNSILKNYYDLLPKN